MELSLRIDNDPAGTEATTLYRWLARDRQLTRHARLSPAAGGPVDGEMSGGSLETINVVLSNSIALASLITSIVAFRKAQKQQRAGSGDPIIVLLERPGRSIAIDDDSTAEGVVELLDAADPAPAAGVTSDGNAR
ncbi:effector-associated constant component EACC1 [Micromonospora sp. CA-111912]|uniref:effector-associated constant component EACC1 n=1 Tax=Micromonospora sp. CA-111912 TaxID=3239955 RepID=UPI003D89E9C1